MKTKLLTIIFLFGFLLAEAQIEVEYHFFSQCESKIITDSISFSLQDIVTGEFYFSEKSKISVPLGKYELDVDIHDGEVQRSYNQKVEFKYSHNIIDTLTIPKILYEVNLNSDLDDSKYYKCDNLCDGYEVEYFENGNKRFEGNFVNGKAIWEREFENDGSSIKYFYNKSDQYTKWEYYDQNGNLLQYFINKYRKKNWIQKTYDAEGKLIKSEVKIYYPIKKN